MFKLHEEFNKKFNNKNFLRKLTRQIGIFRDVSIRGGYANF